MSPQLTYAGVVWGGRRRQNKWIHYMNWIIWINQIHDVRRRLGLFLWKGHFAAVFYAPLAIIVVSIPVALIIYKLLFGWERHTQLTDTPYTHTPKTFFFFSWNRKNLYGLHFDERSFGGDTAAGWSKGFSLSFLT